VVWHHAEVTVEIETVILGVQELFAVRDEAVKGV